MNCALAYGCVDRATVEVRVSEKVVLEPELVRGCHLPEHKHAVLGVWPHVSLQRNAVKKLAADRNTSITT